MMKYIRNYAVCVLIICFAIILKAPQKAAAFDLPSPLKYAGLTFEQPLPDGISSTYLTVNSGPFETIDFTPAVSNPPDPTLSPSPSPSIAPSPVSQVSDVSIIESEVTTTPTPTPTATPTPLESTEQSGSNTSTGGGLNADVLFSMSNNYRTSHGLAPFQTDARVCTLAQERAPEIGAEIASGHMHAGKDSHNFPYWFTENIISMNSEAAAFNWWINDPIHHDAIVGNYTYSCVACSGNSCVQEFTNFSPK